MKVASRITFGLGLFLFVDSLIYFFTAYERTGAALLFIVSLALFYLTLVTRGAAKGAEELSEEETPSASEEKAEEEAVVGPTIWPFGFSVAAIGLVLGVVLSHWLLVLGGIFFAASALGWFTDIRRQHAHMDHGDPAAHRPVEGV